MKLVHSSIFLLFCVANNCRTCHGFKLLPGSRHAVPTAASRHTRRRAAAVATSVPEEDSGDSVASAAFGVIKAMVGTGCLALPAGLAATSNYSTALVPANLLMLVLGVLSGYTFSLYGRLVHDTKAKSLGDLWKKVNGSKSALPVSIVNFAFCIGGLLACNLVYGDMLSSLAETVGLAGTIWAWRQTVILAVSLGILAPLCSLSSLAKLAPVSIVGVLGSMVSTLFVVFRCPAVVKSSPYAVAGKGMLESVKSGLQPKFSSYSRPNSPAPLILLSMACVAFMAHFSAPDFYNSLAKGQPKKADKNAPLKHFNLVTLVSYITVIGVNMMNLSFGYLTFGGGSSGVILNNYATADIGATVCRLLVAVSVIGSFPFLFKSCTSSAVDLFVKGDATKGKERACSTALLFGVTTLSLLVKDAGFVTSFNGALMGTALIYIFPAYLFLKSSAIRVKEGGKRLKLERLFCRFLVGFGALSSLLGAATSVIIEYFPHLLG